MFASTGARKVIRCEIQKAIARPKSEAANLSMCDREVADPGPAGAVNWPTLQEARDAHFCTLQALPGVQFPQAAGKEPLFPPPLPTGGLHARRCGLSCRSLRIGRRCFLPPAHA